MKIDAHYYAVLAFARAVGFNKDSAYQIAYASQFVDDAKINLMYLKEDPGADIRHDVFDGRHLFLNMATCHSYTRIKTFNYDAMINNTCAFHFVPGCEGNRFPEKLRCKEDSEVTGNIINKAHEQPDPIKLGIVLHAYADTFSHQDFSGLLSKANDIQDCKPISDLPLDWRDIAYKIGKFFLKSDMMDKILDKGLPAYGHGQAAWLPDLPYLTWAYTHDLYENAAPAYDYDENRWLKEAFANFDDEKFHQRTVKDVELAPGFPNSNWYKYYLAVEWYKDEFFENCSRLGLDIPR